MGDNASSKKGIFSFTGMIEKLVGDNQVPRMNFLFHTANRADRNNSLNAEAFHSPYIGAVIDFRREETVALSVPGEKSHLPSFQETGEIRSRWLPERGPNADLPDSGEAFHLIETASADNSDFNFFFPGSHFLH